MSVACVPQQAIPTWTSLHADFNSSISSSAPGTLVDFMPVGADNSSRYNNRPPACVAAALYIMVDSLKQLPSRDKFRGYDGIPPAMRHSPNE